MSKKILFWIFLIMGIIWILGASYWYVWIEDLDLRNIKWKENFSSKDSDTQAFFKAVLVVIIPLLVTALLFYCIGLLFGKKAEKNLYEIEKENEQLKNELAQHMDKIETMKVLYTGGKIKRSVQKDEKLILLPKEEKTASDEELKKESSPGEKKDDLKVIEGIGERIEFFLNDSGIYTWEQLSKETEERLKNILELYGGLSYKIHNPVTWPKQAALAAYGKWEELQALKERIKRN
jgi:predicted flap endonuclease-1-like 5' DNA nuclease